MTEAIKGYENLGEMFRQTMNLRWRFTETAQLRETVLEQAWQGDKGSVRWERVPTVTVAAAGEDADASSRQP